MEILQINSIASPEIQNYLIRVLARKLKGLMVVDSLAQQQEIGRTIETMSHDDLLGAFRESLIFWHQ